MIIALKYFEIAGGHLEEINEYLPQLILDYLLKKEDLDDNSTLIQHKFKNEFEVNSPYLLLYFE